MTMQDILKTHLRHCTQLFIANAGLKVVLTDNHFKTRHVKNKQRKNKPKTQKTLLKREILLLKR